MQQQAHVGPLASDCAEFTLSGNDRRRATDRSTDFKHFPFFNGVGKYLLDLYIRGIRSQSECGMYSSNFGGTEVLACASTFHTYTRRAKFWPLIPPPPPSPATLYPDHRRRAPQCATDLPNSGHRYHHRRLAQPSSSPTTAAKLPNALRISPIPAVDTTITDLPYSGRRHHGDVATREHARAT
jgi:hypothetical protein